MQMQQSDWLSYSYTINQPLVYKMVTFSHFSEVLVFFLMHESRFIISFTKTVLDYLLSISMSDS